MGEEREGPREQAVSAVAAELARPDLVGKKAAAAGTGEGAAASRVTATTARPRCAWAQQDPLLARYHDEEWGRPIHDDDELFGRLMLEIFQAGLSWRTVLYKREALRRAFAGFDVRRVAAFTQADVARLLADPAIIRNRAKIEATIANARACLEIRARYGSFRAFLDSLPPDVQAVTAELRKWFRFVGPTMVDSFLQATGRIPPRHEPGCWLAGTGPAARS